MAEEKATELASINCDAWADWTGPRVNRDIRTGDKKTKFSVGLPIPTTDEEAQDLYGVPLARLIEKGVKQHSYDKDTDLSNTIAGWLKAGDDMTTKADDVALACEEDFKAPDKERKGESATEKAERKELAKIKKESGLSYAQILAKLKESGMV